MAAFNFMSHGSQDLYPTFLQKQHGFNPGNVRNVTVFMNIGAILGGTLVGAFSQRIGRRVAIAVCCVLGALLVPFWAGAQSAVLLAVSAFSLQFFVQGAWGVIPAHLNELSPPTYAARSLASLTSWATSSRRTRPSGRPPSPPRASRFHCRKARTTDGRWRSS